MHETFLAEQIADALVKIAQQHAPARLTRAVLKVGPLRQVVPELLLTAMEAALMNSPAAGAEIVIQATPLRGKCRGCSAEFEVLNWSFVCPGCGQNDVALLDGDDLTIETVTLETENSVEPAAQEPTQ
jgi:hydrogenase nickel incorporation protein HypA/HybF